MTCFGECWTAVHLIRWEICHRSAEGAQMRYYPISVKAALCSMLSAQCTHLCTRLGNYQLCTLSFTVVANFFLDSHPWQTNFHSIRIILEDNHWWHSRRLINEGSREKNRPFPEEPSHLTHHLMQPHDKFNHSRKFALLSK